MPAIAHGLSLEQVIDRGVHLVVREHRREAMREQSLLLLNDPDDLAVSRAAHHDLHGGD